ncbi:efflux RND transporter periplasmic adaptor subunit [Candidatus Sumerlaeota bacterium]|nr:efflux RND transporter periplasmic adaptor subunit [Candidatus Sumerlaeota bacterium]
MNATESEKKSVLRRLLFFLKLLEIRLRFVAILVVTALVVGYWDNIQNYYERWQRTRLAQTAEVHKGHVEGVAESEFEFFCPMHPFVVRDRAGKCPICGMDLVQRKKGAPARLPEGTLTRVQVSPQRIMQAGVEVEPVAYRLLVRTVRSYATVEPDETRLAKIIARFGGRVDELMVAATGAEVKKGQPLARIYSPRFLAAAQEYVQALGSQRTTERDPQASADAKRRAREIADYARRRLALAGFTDEQLDAIAATGKADESVVLHSPLAGAVLEKNVLLGEMVDEGTTLYTIADLSMLWVQVQVIESEIGAVKVGMPVEVTAVAWPGEIFYGTVDFIYPTVNAASRSVKVRMVVANRESKLKPGMYVTAVIRSPIGRYGEVASSDELTTGTGTKPKDQTAIAAEVYTCPMHPEVVSNKPGQCPKCGMDLEKKAGGESKPNIIKAGDASNEQWAEGYACPMHLDALQTTGGICQICGCGMKTTQWRVERVLSIPEAAVIDTGARQIVYVETTPGVYDARAVTLGARAGAYYPVLAGLALGERIVSRGSFLIDAEARLNPTTVTTRE